MNNDNITDLQQEAIKSSISNNWKKAIAINEQILENTPDDIPTLNRLGIAYSMEGTVRKATASFQKVLVIDPQNPIAKNNLARLKTNKKQGLANPFLQTVSFIEEPGKSKVVSLVSPGEPKIFSTLNIGEPVELLLSKHKVKVIRGSEFIGYLPDNLSFRLTKLMGAGYKYKSIMKSVNAKKPQVFILESKSSKRLKGIPSFPLDDKDHLPSLSAGESNGSPRLEIYDPLIGDE